MSEGCGGRGTGFPSAGWGGDIMCSCDSCGSLKLGYWVISVSGWLGGRWATFRLMKESNVQAFVP